MGSGKQSLKRQSRSECIGEKEEILPHDRTPVQLVPCPLVFANEE